MCVYQEFGVIRSLDQAEMGMEEVAKEKGEILDQLLIFVVG